MERQLSHKTDLVRKSCTEGKLAYKYFGQMALITDLWESKTSEGGFRGGLVLFYQGFQ